MRLVAIAALVANAGCPYCDLDGVETNPVVGKRWAEADALFHQEPRWLGGDGAYSIDLGGDRTLWLFGDSFIATSPALTRRESTLIRNSVGVMSGRDPLTATMELAWRDGAPPSAFFPDDGEHWFWPMHGVRLPDGPLLIFLAELRPSPGDGLGFAGAGYRVVRVADPDGPPSSWTIEPISARPVPYAAESAIGACGTLDGRGNFVAVAVDGDSEHRGRLVRWPLTALAAGDLGSPAWWTGDAWTPQAELDRAPAVVFPNGGSECSLSHDDGDGWTYIASRGFGASTIALRLARELEGPWSPPQDTFAPAGTFVYAAKGHPGVVPRAGYQLVVTFADNSFTFDDLFDPELEQTLYWPHFVVLQFRHIAC